jgi:hypothetical protein
LSPKRARNSSTSMEWPARKLISLVLRPTVRPDHGVVVVP